MSPVKPVDDSEWEVTHEPFPETFNFERAGDTLIGTYKGSKTVAQTGLDGNPRDAIVYSLQDTDGKDWGIWGNYSLDQAFADIKSGTMCRVEFLGKIPIDG